MRTAFWTAALALFALAGTATAEDWSFSYATEQQALTSAGIYNADGKLVKVLWTMQDTAPGEHRATWDGTNQFGEKTVGEKFTFRVIVNPSEYKNVGAIGNSARKPTPLSHNPTNIESVAIDAQGAIYTANGWDEAGADFKKWNADGVSIYDARYQIRNGNPNGAPYSIAVDDEFLYCGMYGWAREPFNEKAQIQRFRLSDGKHVKFTKVDLESGHIQLYEWPSKQVPEGTDPLIAAIMSKPLQALAIAGDTIFATDALGGKILKFHKVTGKSQGEFSVKLPHALACDKDGRIWVGHELHKISIYKQNGTKIADVFSDLGKVESLAFGPNGLLYVADSDAGMVKVFNVTGDEPKLVTTLGQKAQPGDRAPNKFFHLKGAAIDSQRNIVTIQTEPAGGARLARWTPGGELIWEHFGNEFVSLGNYGSFDPDTFYSMTFHKYKLLDREKGTWKYTANVAPSVENRRAVYPSYVGDSSLRKFSADVHGVPRALRLGKNYFWFMPTGDGVQVYRIGEKAMHMAALVGGGWPSPDGTRGPAGEWTWHDANGTGMPAPEEINWHRQPGTARYSVFGMDVDLDGNILFGNLRTHSIWEVPLLGADKRGNPVYDWAKAGEIIPADKSSLRFMPNMVQRADDGTYYAFGWSDPWPQPKGNPFWMGGTTLVHFDKSGNQLWAIKLPEVSVGLDVIPGGGCMVGSGRNARIYHYTADGLLIGTLQPGEPMGFKSGWLDNHASVAVNRDPRDGMLEVFAEDDYLLRLAWYRVDDSRIRKITGELSR